MDRGILYVATNDSLLYEAERAATWATNIVDLPISIVSHKRPDSAAFDSVIIDENPTKSVADKSRNLLKSPYRQTIFVDADTYILDNISELYSSIGPGQPVAVTLDPHEGSLWDLDQYDIPLSFPEYQTGVIVYNKSPRAKDFIDNWVGNHEPLDSPDQLSFRRTAFEDTINISVFPLRYNAMIGSEVYGRVKILHDYQRFLKIYDYEDLVDILEGVNENEGMRRLDTFHYKYIPTVSLSLPLPVRLSMAGIHKVYRRLSL